MRIQIRITMLAALLLGFSTLAAAQTREAVEVASLGPQVGERVPGLMERAREIATGRGPAIAAAAQERMRAELEPVVVRLVELAQVNPAIDIEEIDAARGELAALDEGLRGVRVRLDGLRLILVAAE